MRKEEGESTDIIDCPFTRVQRLTPTLDTSLWGTPLELFGS